MSAFMLHQFAFVLMHLSAESDSNVKSFYIICNYFNTFDHIIKLSKQIMNSMLHFNGNFLQRFTCVISGDLNIRSARELHKCMQRDPESDATGGNINKQSRVQLTRPLPAQRGAATSCRRHDAKVTSICCQHEDTCLPLSLTTRHTSCS